MKKTRYDFPHFMSKELFYGSEIPSDFPKVTQQEKDRAQTELVSGTPFQTCLYHSGWAAESLLSGDTALGWRVSKCWKEQEL